MKVVSHPLPSWLRSESPACRQDVGTQTYENGTGLRAWAEDWRWASLARCQTPHADAEPRLSRWPIDRPADWTLRVNMPVTPAEDEAVQRSIRRGQPYCTERRQKRTASQLGLASLFRPRGRPVKKPNNGT